MSFSKIPSSRSEKSKWAPPSAGMNVFTCETDVLGLTPQMFGMLEGNEKFFSATYPGDEWAQHELVHTGQKKSRFHHCQGSRVVSPNS